MGWRTSYAPSIHRIENVCRNLFYYLQEHSVLPTRIYYKQKVSSRFQHLTIHRFNTKARGIVVKNSLPFLFRRKNLSLEMLRSAIIIIKILWKCSTNFFGTRSIKRLKFRKLSECINKNQNIFVLLQNDRW